MALKEQMELFDVGGLKDEGGTTDPVSGNDVPVGSTQEEVRDDIPAQLSEGEFVLPADVVRYHGLEKIMELRDEAKAGLAKMEAMGQMGNSEEATLPDDVPFSMDDLELEDDGMDFQVGGFVPNQGPGQGFPSIPPGIPTPSGNFGINTQLATPVQSQFTNYQPPSIPTIPTPNLPNYQAPQQQFTPIAQQVSTPNFSSFVIPKTAVYVDKDGNTINVPIDENGNPLIPIPPGYSKQETKTDKPEEVAAPTTTTTTAPPSDSGGDGGGIITPTPKSDLEKERDSIKADPRFKDILEEFDNRTGIQKFADTVAGVSPVLSIFGGGTRSKEFAQLEADLVRGVQSVPANQRDELYKELAITTEQVKQGRLPEQGLAPVIDMTTPEARAKAIEEGKITTSPDQVRDVTQTAVTDITDMSPEAMQRAADELQTGVGVQSARVTEPSISAVDAARIDREERGEFDPEGIDDRPEITSEIAGRTTIPADFATTTRTRSSTPVAADETVGLTSDSPFNIEEFERDVRRDRTTARDRVDAGEFADRRTTRAAPTKTASERAADIETERFGRAASRVAAQSAERESTISGHQQRYEDSGYSPSAARAAAVNKTDADAEARQQTGDPRSTAVTSSSGKAVRSSSGNVVTNDPDNQSTGGSCVIATHGVSTGKFSLLDKAKAELWCEKTYHGKWYGEAFRRGYRYHANRAVQKGVAHEYYTEFKNFVACGRGLRKDIKSKVNYYIRTIQFFATGLFVK